MRHQSWTVRTPVICPSHVLPLTPSISDIYILFTSLSLLILFSFLIYTLDFYKPLTISVIPYTMRRPHFPDFPKISYFQYIKLILFFCILDPHSTVRTTIPSNILSLPTHTEWPLFIHILWCTQDPCLLSHLMIHYSSHNFIYCHVYSKLSKALHFLQFLPILTPTNLSYPCAKPQYLAYIRINLPLYHTLSHMIKFGHQPLQQNVKCWKPLIYSFSFSVRYYVYIIILMYIAPGPL